MTDDSIEALIENARLLGMTQAKKRFSSYSKADSIFEKNCYENIETYSNKLKVDLREKTKQEPLTRSEIQKILSQKFFDDTMTGDDIVFVKAIEKAHGIK